MCTNLQQIEINTGNPIYQVNYWGGGGGGGNLSTPIILLNVSNIDYLHTGNHSEPAIIANMVNNQTANRSQQFFYNVHLIHWN